MGAVYVNLSGVYFDGRWRLETRVERIEVATGRRSILSAVDFAALLSLSSSGALLARDTGTDRLSGRQWRSDERSRDRVLIPAGNPVWVSRATSRADGLTVSESLDLGAYELFNDYLQIDGAPHLYFVQGTSDSHESRWICRIDPYSLRVERLFPLAWDLNRGADVHIGGGLYVSDGIGPALIMSYQRFNTRRRPIGAASIVRRRLDDGRTLWAADFDGTVTAMAAMPERNVVAFALDDGQVGSVSADTGDVRGLQSAALNGVPIMYLALAARGDRIAAGTIDGRIVISKLVE
jgi:hypothetical protein